MFRNQIVLFAGIVGGWILPLIGALNPGDGAFVGSLPPSLSHSLYRARARSHSPPLSFRFSSLPRALSRPFSGRFVTSIVSALLLSDSLCLSLALSRSLAISPPPSLSLSLSRALFRPFQE